MRRAKNWCSAFRRMHRALSEGASLFRPTILALLLAALPIQAAQQTGEPLQLNARGTIQLAFTPGDDAAGLVVEAIRKARRQVLVQAYSFTHKDIAQALVDAKRRGIDVQVVADRKQMETIATSRVEWLAEQGVPVWVDAEHAAAHSKVMLIDTGAADAAVITGSFNFTHAAQFRNAENLLILRGNPNLAEAFAANWRRHKIHSFPLRK
ncbi:MAG: phospholipase D family protein [Pseudomonadota bacterium]|nr:phospholipase D family protein [Pseudomonadota bacterium]